MAGLFQSPCTLFPLSLFRTRNSFGNERYTQSDYPHWVVQRWKHRHLQPISNLTDLALPEPVRIVHWLLIWVTHACAHLFQFFGEARVAAADDARIAGQLSIAYLMAIAGKVLRSFPIDLLDLLLVTTIANFNVTPPAEPQKKRTAATDRTGISRNAVSRALNVPLETVRRRVANLIAKDILNEQADGLVFSPNNPIGLGNNAELNAFNLEMLRLLFRGLKANGIKLD
jgi:hypothetical protein